MPERSRSAAYVRLAADSKWSGRLRERADGAQLHPGNGRHLRSPDSGRERIFRGQVGRAAKAGRKNNSAPIRTWDAPSAKRGRAETAEVADLIGGGAWTRTTDLRIMRPSL